MTDARRDDGRDGPDGHDDATTTDGRRTFHTFESTGANSVHRPKCTIRGEFVRCWEVHGPTKGFRSKTSQEARCTSIWDI